MPNKAFASNIQTSITRSKKYTHAPINQRYLYNNITDVERKFYDGELQAAITANPGVGTEQFDGGSSYNFESNTLNKTPIAGSVLQTIQRQLPTSSRNIKSHVPMDWQLETAAKSR